MDWIARNAPVLLLGAALAVAAGMTLALTSEMTYFGDSWGLLITRREIGIDTILHPHNEHLIAVPALIEMLFLRLFGMDPTPGQLLLIALLLSTAVLLFVYVRRRVGPWFALFAAVLILFLGPAYEVLLWPFEITFCGPVLFGLAMLLALEREDMLGDVAACLFLIASLGFSSLGVPFIAGAAVAVLIGPREDWLRRSYVFVIPAALFAAWFLGWGRESESQIALRFILESPRAVLDSMTTAVASLLGLGAIQPGGLPDRSWGRAALVGLVIVVGYWLLRRRPVVSRTVWPVAATAAATWFLTAFPGREPAASRYQYAAGIFVLMILANLFRDARPGRNAILAGAAVTALAVAPNLVDLRDGANFFKRQSVIARADTAAIEIASRTVDPTFQLAPEVAGSPNLVNVYAGEYLEAVDEYGSPAYSPAELESAPEEGRVQADVVLGEALPIATDTLRRREVDFQSLGCLAVNEQGTRTEIPLRPRSAWIVLSPGPPGSLSMRRFAAENYPVELEDAPGGAVTRIRIPRDTTRQPPWRLLVESRQTAHVCQ